MNNDFFEQSFVFILVIFFPLVFISFGGIILGLICSIIFYILLIFMILDKKMKKEGEKQND